MSQPKIEQMQLSNIQDSQDSHNAMLNNSPTNSLRSELDFSTDNFDIDDSELYDDNIHSTQDLIDQFVSFYFPPPSPVSDSCSVSNTSAHLDSIQQPSPFHDSSETNSHPQAASTQSPSQPAWDSRFNNLLMVAFAANDRQRADVRFDKL
jgi:hypothetical protein